MQLLLPMAGESRRFFEAGYTEPKPFFKIGERQMISRVLEQFPERWKRIFVLNEKMKAFEGEALQHLVATGALKYVVPNKMGPLLSAEKGLDAADLEDEIFLSYCDYKMIWDVQNFEAFVKQSDCDICIVTYTGFHPHYLTPNMYCYVRTEGDKVIELREKACFTSNREAEHASTGGYYFKSAALLKEGLKLQRDFDFNWEGEYFTSFAIQALMRVHPNLEVRVFEIPYFFQWGTPEDVKAFEFWEDRFRKKASVHVGVEEEKQLALVAPQYARRLPDQARYFEKAFQGDYP